MIMSKNLSEVCPKSGGPDLKYTGIDSKSPAVITSRVNITDPDDTDDWMVACCAPNQVQIYSSADMGPCWEWWCEEPPAMAGTEKSFPDSFTRCTREEAEARNASCVPNSWGSRYSSSAAAGDVVGVDGAVASLVMLFVLV
jgi:hypothetical protein